MHALIFALLIGLLAYGTAWTIGLAHFDPPSLGTLIPTLLPTTPWSGT